MWDAPDAMEQRMIDGCPSMHPWPEELHSHHAWRRWQEAKHKYRQQHPTLAEMELADLIGEEARARRRKRS
jgi:hypothetical protein